MKSVICAANLNEISRIILHYNARLIFSLKNNKQVYFHSDKNSTYYFLIIGMGYKNSKKNLKFFINKFHLDSSFQWILTGFCGAVKADLSIGTIVFPKTVKDGEKDFKISNKKFSSSSAEYTLFSVNKIYGRNDKERLVKIYPETDVIDMEGVGYCEIMEENDIFNYTIFKSVTDTIDFIFPDFRLIRGSIFSVPLKTLVSVILKDPKQVKYFITIYRNMRRGFKGDLQDLYQD